MRLLAEGVSCVCGGGCCGWCGVLCAVWWSVVVLWADRVTMHARVCAIAGSQQCTGDCESAFAGDCGIRRALEIVVCVVSGRMLRVAGVWCVSGVMLLCTLTRTPGVGVCCGATAGGAGVWMAADPNCTYDVRAVWRCMRMRLLAGGVVCVVADDADGAETVCGVVECGAVGTQGNDTCARAFAIAV
jgi:hypothetical protein